MSYNCPVREEAARRNLFTTSAVWRLPQSFEV